MMVLGMETRGVINGDQAGLSQSFQIYYVKTVVR